LVLLLFFMCVFYFVVNPTHQYSFCIISFDNNHSNFTCTFVDYLDLPTTCHLWVVCIFQYHASTSVLLPLLTKPVLTQPVLPQPLLSQPVLPQLARMAPLSLGLQAPQQVQVVSLALSLEMGLEMMHAYHVLCAGFMPSYSSVLQRRSTFPAQAAFETTDFIADSH